MRLFVALRPLEPVLLHLDLALRTVAVRVDTGDRSSPVRWTEVENRHLTVAFFGEVADALVGDLDDEIDADVTGVEPFELHLRGAGVFAHRALWVGVGGDVDALRWLSDAVGRAGADFVARSDDRVGSRPHLTVGRVDPSIRRLRSRWTPPGATGRPSRCARRSACRVRGSELAGRGRAPPGIAARCWPRRGTASHDHPHPPPRRSVTAVRHRRCENPAGTRK